MLHEGLGDRISYASAIKQLGDKELILLPTSSQGRKMDNLRMFYDGLNVKWMPLKPNTDVYSLIEKFNGIGIGWFSKRDCKITDFNVAEHYKEGYEKLELDYSSRDKFCPIRENVKKVKQLPVPNEPYAFIPEGGSTNQFVIDRKYVTKGLKEVIPPQDALMLEWADIIYNATEIHAHDTSWWSFINILPTKCKPTFHLYARPECYIYNYDIIYLKEWGILK